MQMSHDLRQITSLLHAWRGLVGDAVDIPLTQALCSTLLALPAEATTPKGSQTHLGLHFLSASASILISSKTCDAIFVNSESTMQGLQALLSQSLF